MDSLPSIRFEPDALPEGCAWIGSSASTKPQAVLNPWQDPTQKLDLLLLLAATRTAEQEGISAAGFTAISRRYTALADAELLLRGPSQPRRWPLPPLPAGVSPALLSHVAVRDLSLSTNVAALGLVKAPEFVHLRLESPDQGPAECLSTGAAMPLQRVRHLWCQGERIGSRLRRPLVLAECVPGGTTTAQAVLTALKIPVDTLISGSARQPPHGLKRKLVAAGLKRARLGRAASVLEVLAAVEIRSGRWGWFARWCCSFWSACVAGGRQPDAGRAGPCVGRSSTPAAIRPGRSGVDRHDRMAR